MVLCSPRVRVRPIGQADCVVPQVELRAELPVPQVAGLLPQVDVLDASRGIEQPLVDLPGVRQVEGDIRWRGPAPGCCSRRWQLTMPCELVTLIEVAAAPTPCRMIGLAFGWLVTSALEPSDQASLSV